MLCNSKLGKQQQRVVVAKDASQGILNHQDQAVHQQLSRMLDASLDLA
jgi:hypothetical protein